MSKVIFRKHPLDTTAIEGKPFTLSVKSLSTTGLPVFWDADLGKGWEEVGTGKTLVVSKATKAHAGRYRCVVGGHASRYAKVTILAKEGVSEGDAFDAILNETGVDAKPEVVAKAAKAVSKKMPAALKE
jgi:hypothetical protein